LQKKRQFIKDKIVVGIDPGSKKHQAVILDENGLQLGNTFSFDHDYQGFNEMLWINIKKQIKTNNKNRIVFAIETSCNLWQKLAYYLDSQKFQVLLVSPLTTHRSRPFFNHDFSKTDPKDALLMASNAKDGYFDFYQTYSAHINAMHLFSITYCKLRRNYVQQRTRLRAFVDLVFPEFLTILNLRTNTARYLLTKYFLPKHFINMDIEHEANQIEKISGKQHGKDTLISLQQVAQNSIGIPITLVELLPAKITLDSWLNLLDYFEQQMDFVIKQLVALAKDTIYFELIISLKGISEKSAALFIAETRDLSIYDHFKKIEKYAGFNLRQSQSSQYVGARRISHIGNKRLAWILYRMTEEAAKYIPEVRIKYLKRQIKRRKHRKNIIACTPILLKLIVSLVKENRTYELKQEKLQQLAKLELQYMEIKAKDKKTLRKAA